MHRHALNSMTSPNVQHPLDPNRITASREPAQHTHIHYFKRRRVLHHPHHRKSLYNKYILYIYFSQKKPPKNEDVPIHHRVRMPQFQAAIFTSTIIKFAHSILLTNIITSKSKFRRLCHCKFKRNRLLTVNYIILS